jgi:hypothetical protein
MTATDQYSSPFISLDRLMVFEQSNWILAND